MANNTAGLVAGIILTGGGVIGIALIIFLAPREWGLSIPFVYAAIALGIGIYLLVNNKREDAIEQIKTRKTK
jgi:hypothetical protein